MTTLEEKREACRQIMTAMAKRERAFAAERQAAAMVHSTYADFIEHRVSILDTLDELSLDLAIANYQAARDTERAVTRMRSARYHGDCLADEALRRLEAPADVVTENPSVVFVIAEEPKTP